MTGKSSVWLALSLALTVAGAGGPPPASGKSIGAVPMSEPWEPLRPRDRSEERLPDGWYARVSTTEGEFLVWLHPDQAPQSVAWFAAAADGRVPWTDSITGEVRQGRYYDGLAIQRVDAGSMLEFGGQPGAPDIFVPASSGPRDFSAPWRIGNVGTGVGRNSALQVFVTAAANPALSAAFPCFGTVVQGKEVVFRITSVKTHANGRPKQPVIIERVAIERKGSPPDLVEPRPHEPSTQRFGPRNDLRPR